MTADILTAIFAAVLSLAAAYLPGFSDWFAALETVYKRLVMAGGLLLIAIAVVVGVCAGFGPDLGLNTTCDRAGIAGVVRAFIYALMANQATYSLAVKK